ncbi:hypothetical protein [Streptomyces sp. NPDC007369]|uniref:hypothetical protein n=1 Tax=Streptomyces sp. NPDC007369 TaxID=3154589 RepID=UPI0033E48FBD
MRPDPGGGSPWPGCPCPTWPWSSSEQTYTPLGGRRVRYASGSFSSDVVFDGDRLVLDHPGLATGLADSGT